MTQICVALVEETTAGMVARMAELAPQADLFEIRGLSLPERFPEEVSAS